MLNNIKISQTTNEIILNINVTANIDDIILELKEKIIKLKEFYKRAETPIRITGRLFTENEKANIEMIINKELDVTISFDKTSDLLGLHAIKKTFEAEMDVTETKFLKTSLRSGQVEEYSGSLVIIGDVNAGAEVVAGGNIAIIGALRGVAHAGAGGNINAIITANYIDSTQIRIANLVREVEEKIEKCPVCKIVQNEIKIS